jgi:hypothetical protein
MPMPQLIIALLVAGLGYYGWRAYKRETKRVERELARKRAPTKPTGKVLEEDPETGVYRPRDNKD